MCIFFKYTVNVLSYWSVIYIFYLQILTKQKNSYISMNTYWLCEYHSLTCIKGVPIIYLGAHNILSPLDRGYKISPRPYRGRGWGWSQNKKLRNPSFDPPKIKKFPGWTQDPLSKQSIQPSANLNFYFWSMHTLQLSCERDLYRTWPFFSQSLFE